MSVYMCVCVGLSVSLSSFRSYIPAKGAAMISAAMTTQILPATPIFGARRSEMKPPRRQPTEPEVAGTHDIHEAIEVGDSPAAWKYIYRVVEGRGRKRDGF